MKRVLAAKLTVYSGMSSTSEVVAELHPLEQITLGKTIQQDGKAWVAVTIPGGAKGYVSGDIKVYGPRRVGLSQTRVLLIALLVSGFVPAAYIGNLFAKGFAEYLKTSGPLVAIMLAAMAGIVLCLLGAAAVAVEKTWPRGFPVVGGTAFIGLAGLSIWMFTNLKEATEGVFIFGITVIVLALMGLLAKAVGQR